MNSLFGQGAGYRELIQLLIRLHKQTQIQIFLPIMCRNELYFEHYTVYDTLEHGTCEKKRATTCTLNA